MTIWMDKHEKGAVVKYVYEECDDVKKSDNFGADYAVGDYLIERKRWDEIPGRLMDSESDLHWQLTNLIKAADALDKKPALLIEGSIGDAFKHTKLPPERVSSYLDGATLLGVEQMVAPNARSTAKKLSRLEDGTPPDVRRVRGTVDDPMNEPRFILEGVQGIGPSTAESLLAEFGTVANVAKAATPQLQRVKGVGPSTATKIREAFNQEWEPE